jgi:hypothetical protein
MNMFDPSWISLEAHKIHDILFDTALTMASILVLLSVIADNFRLSFLSFIPNASDLLSRLFIAFILLYFYPEIADTLSGFTDSLVERIGGLSEISHVLDKMGEKLKDFSWNWTSLKDTSILILSFLTFFLLYISVFITNAGAMYVWVILYVTSPILIILFLMPATEGATKTLFRSLIEVCCWKIMWGISAALLWSSALGSMNSSEVNYLTVISYNLILAISLLLTPMVVSSLAGAGISNVVNSAMGLAAGAATLSPGILAKSVSAKAYDKTKNLTLNSLNQIKGARAQRKSVHPAFDKSIPAPKHPYS